MKQHTSPCKMCPFSKTTTPGYLGGSSAETYVGQVYGPFYLPCHSTHDHTQLSERLNLENPQCAGAAIHRANIGRDKVLPSQILHLPADSEKVFTTQAEFLAFHKGCISVEEADNYLTEKYTPIDHMNRELFITSERAKQGKAVMEMNLCT